MIMTTCPTCSGLHEFIIRDFKGNPSNKPDIKRITCHRCKGKGQVPLISTIHK